MRINANAALNVDNIQSQLDWFKAEKLVDNGITFDTVVDTSYLPTP